MARKGVSLLGDLRDGAVILITYDFATVLGIRLEDAVLAGQQPARGGDGDGSERLALRSPEVVTDASGLGCQRRRPGRHHRWQRIRRWFAFPAARRFLFCPASGWKTCSPRTAATTWFPHLTTTTTAVLESLLRGRGRPPLHLWAPCGIRTVVSRRRCGLRDSRGRSQASSPSLRTLSPPQDQP